MRIDDGRDRYDNYHTLEAWIKSNAMRDLSRSLLCHVVMYQKRGSEASGWAMAEDVGSCCGWYQDGAVSSNKL